MPGHPRSEDTAGGRPRQEAGRVATPSLGATELGRGGARLDGNEKEVPWTMR
jgi:hypothetical protein